MTHKRAKSTDDVKQSPSPINGSAQISGIIRMATCTLHGDRSNDISIAVHYESRQFCTAQDDNMTPQKASVGQIHRYPRKRQS